MDLESDLFYLALYHTLQLRPLAELVNVGIGQVKLRVTSRFF
jgi:hypothetical protein